MSTPPNQPGQAKPDKAKQTLAAQLDELLIQIEEVEPGALDQDVLPQSYLNERVLASLANAEQAVQSAVETPTPAAVTETPPPPTEAPEASPEQADMLAALNSALQGMGGATPADEPAPSEPAADTDASLSMEDKLQAEIASLMNSDPQVAEPTVTETEASELAAKDTLDEDTAGNFESPENLADATQPASSSATNTEDQIAMEIEGLLNADQAQPESEAPDETGIDELDKMLAQEIDADDELAGDFQSVEQLTAGIQVPEQMDTATEDAHAATARDVAAELDSQPEDLPKAAEEPIATPQAPAQDDPFAVLEQLPTTERKSRDEDEHSQRDAMRMPNWAYWVETARELLLNACFVLNWPARRYLTTEWRANLGYIALLNLFFGVGLWIVLILF